ncbi:MAG: hypothetical protein SFW66_04085 [Gammaproteobacteria bacterium]|nr:hypothetical protein [Gammaproteobacteria bacterium]
MRFGYVCCIALLTLNLAACTSPHMSGEVAAGKSDFQAGNYASAFQRLLPVARAGRADAQYAVGYMYYYGYGVSQDAASGLQWMKRAEAQDYPPAIKALDMIEHRDAFKKQQKKPLTDSFGVNERDDVVNAPVSKKSPPKQPVPLQTTVVSQNTKSSLIVNTQREAVSQNPKSLPTVNTKTVAVSQHPKSSRYVLQLFGDYKIDTVYELQRKLHLASDSAILHTKHLGRDWYILTTGHYDTVATANVAINHLPQHLKSMHPWVRPTEGLTAGRDIA